MKQAISKILSLVFVLQFLFFQIWVSAQFVVPPYDEYVTDAAGVISASDEKNMESLIYEIWQTTDVEIAVLTVESLSGEAAWYAGMQVGEERGVGDAEHDNGVVILVSINDREWTIQVGYGLEGVLPDAVCKKIGESQFPTYFREGNYAQGITAAIQDMYKYIQEDPEIIALYQESQTGGQSDLAYVTKNKTFWFTLLGVVYFIAGFFLADKFVLEKGGTKKARKFRKKDGWTNFALIAVAYSAILSVLTADLVTSVIESIVLLFISTGLVASPGGTSSGSSSSRSSSSSYSSRSYSSSSSSSSSFGGFGGGSFGGGGASGKR